LSYVSSYGHGWQKQARGNGNGLNGKSTGRSLPIVGFVNMQCDIRKIVIRVLTSKNLGDVTKAILSTLNGLMPLPHAPARNMPSYF